MVKVGDLVKHRRLAWIGKVIEIEKKWPNWRCLSNWRHWMYFWRPYYRVAVMLEEDGMILLDKPEKWEAI